MTITSGDASAPRVDAASPPRSIGASSHEPAGNGISVVAARHVLLEGLGISNTGRSVVDLEVLGIAGLDDVTFRDSIIEGGHGMLLANKGSDHSQCDNVTVENITVIGNGACGIR
ncbi:MAG: hypothetical protein ACXV2J_10970, partial [Actinomycetes bacterium]